MAGNFWSESLSVVPVSGNLWISSSELDSQQYWDATFTKVPTDHITDVVPNVDLILCVSTSNDQCLCTQFMLAVAVCCNFDQYDWPTAGAINVCLGNIQLVSDGMASQNLVQDYFDVIIHQSAHVLGLPSKSFHIYSNLSMGKLQTPMAISSTGSALLDWLEVNIDLVVK